MALQGVLSCEIIVDVMHEFRLTIHKITPNHQLHVIARSAKLHTDTHDSRYTNVTDLPSTKSCADE